MKHEDATVHPADAGLIEPGVGRLVPERGKDGEADDHN